MPASYSIEKKETIWVVFFCCFCAEKHWHHAYATVQATLRVRWFLVSVGDAVVQWLDPNKKLYGAPINGLAWGEICALFEMVILYGPEMWYILWIFLVHLPAATRAATLRFERHTFKFTEIPPKRRRSSCRARSTWGLKGGRFEPIGA